VAATIPASAQLARPQAMIDSTGSNDLLTTVQFRRGGFRGGYRGGYRGGRYGYGPAIGLGIATGAIIGGILATQPRGYYVAPGGDAVAYCMQRFKSYDPASGTYLGFDGFRHPCP
jgi:hypothetical protein